MPVTRSRSAEMEDTLRQLVEMMTKNQERMEEMKDDLKLLKTSQNEMKNNQAELKISQEELKSEMKNNQEELKNEVKNSLEESNKKLEELMKEKFKDFEEAVEEEISQLRDEVKQHSDKVLAVENKFQAVEENMTALKCEVEEIQKEVARKFTQLSTTGVIKTESSSASSRVKPPTFDGKIPWSTYLKQFEAAAKANNWSDVEKATSLTVALRGEAMEILRTMSEESQTDYQMLKAALEMRYGEAHMQHVYQAQLKGRIQRFEESLQQYEADIARMVKLAYPTAPVEFQDQLAVSCFVDGLRDSEISKALRLARNKNISEALAQALEIEAAQQASRRSQGRSRQIRYQAGEQHRNDRNVEELLKTFQDALDNFQKGQRRTDGTVFSRRRPIQCWSCGAEGHLKNRCPKNTPDQDQGNAN